MRQLIVGLVVLIGTCALTAADDRPNIIVILTDDHGWADLGAQDIQRDIRTPHLDSLAAGGVRVVSGYVTAPQCVPSRAGLLSGRYQNRFGVESNEQYQQPGGLDGFGTSLTFAERLQSAGYATGMAGKWHLGAPENITAHGFDKVFFKHNNAAGYWNMDLEGRDLAAGPQRGGYHLDVVADFACAFIRRFAEQPFCFYLAYRGPHTPLDAPEKYTDRFPGPMPERRRQALAMISAIDDGVGRIMATLRERQLEERTLIFFLGDNGAPLKIHKLDSPLDGDAGGWDGSLNAPMNGEKGMLSEGGIRVPWLAYWKGRIPAGQVFQHPVISLDVAATATALAGLTPGPGELDGVNLLPHFSGENPTPPHPALYWRWVGQSAVREGNWKLVLAGPRSYLFDLSSDPEERHNLIQQHPEIAAGLRQRLEAWGGELQPPGIATKPLPRAGEQFFDHYFDGKRVEPTVGPPTAAAASPAANWIVRNARAEVQDGVLRIAATGAGRQKPFVAFSGLKVAGPATAEVQFRVARAGQLGLAWRLASQKDFAKEQVVLREVTAGDEFQSMRLEIPTSGNIIHLRLLLPGGDSDLRSLTLSSSSTSTGPAAEPWRATF